MQLIDRRGLRNGILVPIALFVLLMFGCGEAEDAAESRNLDAPIGVFVGVVPEEMKADVMRALEDMHARATTEEEKEEIRRQIDEGTSLPETKLTMNADRTYKLTSEDRTLTEGSWFVEGAEITLYADTMLDIETGQMVPVPPGPDSEAKATWSRESNEILLHSPSGDMVFKLSSGA